MRTSHFAAIQLIVPEDTYKPGEANQKAMLKTVGMAQNLRISDNFGSRAVNVIGTPLPILASGFTSSSISMDKATIDGASFRSAGMNPLFAHIGKTYQNDSIVSLSEASGALGEAALLSSGNQETYPFLFVLSIKNKVSNSYSKSPVTYDNQPVHYDTDGTPQPSPFGMYACILQSADISMSSQQAIILDSVQAIARPITGTWLTEVVREGLNNQGNTGLQDVVNSIMYGYRPR